MTYNETLKRKIPHWWEVGQIADLCHFNQTQELTTLRDWLLPMLMNGQVTVG